MLISIILCFIGYFVYRFGMLGKGLSSNKIEFAGGLILFASFVYVVFIGWKQFSIQLLIFWIVITPITEIMIQKLFREMNRQ